MITLIIAISLAIAAVSTLMINRYKRQQKNIEFVQSVISDIVDEFSDVDIKVD